MVISYKRYKHKHSKAKDNSISKSNLQKLTDIIFTFRFQNLTERDEILKNIL